MKLATGTLPLAAFVRAIGSSRTTLMRWMRDGISGVPLPCEYRGGRVYVSWEAYREWQEQIRMKRLRLKPVPRRKTSPEAIEALRRNGYIT